MENITTAQGWARLHEAEQGIARERRGLCQGSVDEAEWSHPQKPGHPGQLRWKALARDSVGGRATRIPD